MKNRKATRQVVDSWLVAHANPGGGGGIGSGSGATSGGELASPIHSNTQPCSSRGGSGATTPVR